MRWNQAFTPDNKQPAPVNLQLKQAGSRPLFLIYGTVFANIRLQLHPPISSFVDMRLIKRGDLKMMNHSILIVDDNDLVARPPMMFLRGWDKKFGSSCPVLMD